MPLERRPKVPVASSLINIEAKLVNTDTILEAANVAIPRIGRTDGGESASRCTVLVRRLLNAVSDQNRPINILARIKGRPSTALRVEYLRLQGVVRAVIKTLRSRPF